MKSISLLYFALCMMQLSDPSHAEERLPNKPTNVELLALPDYCKARFSGDASVQRSWIMKMGKDNFSHLHHFCTGLNYMNRIKVATGSKHRKHYIQSALGDFNYVIRNWPQDFYLTTEAKMYKGQLEFQLKMK